MEPRQQAIFMRAALLSTVSSKAQDGDVFKREWRALRPELQVKDGEATPMTSPPFFLMKSLPMIDWDSVQVFVEQYPYSC